MTRMNHYYSNEWCMDNRARTQEELQAIAREIRENCKVQNVSPVLGQDDESYICTIYANENLGIRFWVKDRFGHISEIDEAREC